jgi:hypothetical protein
VRAEAAIAALALGRDEARTDVERLLVAGSGGEPGGLSRERRAALALSRLRVDVAVPVLEALVRDPEAHEGDRMKALEALGTIGGEASVSGLVAGLAEVRLREAAARALARVGGKRAADALVAQLTEERYEPARRAEAEALVALRDPRVLPLLLRFLGTETSVPSGVRLLMDLSALNLPPARGALLTDPATRTGSWTCADRACTPGSGARLLLAKRQPAADGNVRIVLWIGEADPGAVLQVDGTRLTLKGGEQQVSFTALRGRPLPLNVSGEGNIALIGWVVVPETDEIPPPAPEPWDAGPEAGQL